MKIVNLYIVLFLFSLLALHVSAQSESAALERAKQYGAKGKITLRVVDSSGQPVEGADVVIKNRTNGTDMWGGSVSCMGNFISREAAKTRKI